MHDAHYPAYALAKYPVIGLYDPDQARAAYMAAEIPRAAHLRKLSRGGSVCPQLMPYLMWQCLLRA